MCDSMHIFVFISDLWTSHNCQVTAIKSKLKGELKVELKLKTRMQMKNDNSKIVMFKNSITCWNKRSKCKV